MGHRRVAELAQHFSSNWNTKHKSPIDLDDSETVRFRRDVVYWRRNLCFISLYSLCLKYFPFR